ncbi:hypothetical protein HBH98_252820 [Parastagonospora nodorum]|nr:hypothetical protein HBH49_113180 [Parastagonospora nodorum]KAH4091102.1 hypothetical protein HBH46_187000 [Parastagonospora nodorum]KAH4193927.1 hypothetical protein HBH42_090380 [Parastagonospora nodorum]KAH4256105.1 hypothetical protein HBI03_165780 [Parastagonospora nodorum]KAH4332770.1 hypothetical protein HBH98_252820 [Parastagonospora nodorum]
MDYFSLLGFGDMGKRRHPSFIFFAKTKYAWSASTCVAYVFSRFIHIFRHEAFSSVISSEGFSFGDSSSVEPSDDELLAILEKKLERTGVEGTLFVAAGFEGVFFEEGTVFADSVRDGFGLDGASFSLSFDEELFDVFVFGDLGGSVFDRDSFGGALSGNAPMGAFGEVFAGAGFDAAGFEDAAFGDVGFDGAIFGEGGLDWAAALGGAAFGMMTLGGGELICAAGGCAVNCPFAICLARSLTLRNMLKSDTDRFVIKQC